MVFNWGGGSIQLITQFQKCFPYFPFEKSITHSPRHGIKNTQRPMFSETFCADSENVSLLKKASSDLVLLKTVLIHNPNYRAKQEITSTRLSTVPSSTDTSKPHPKQQEKGEIRHPLKNTTILVNSHRHACHPPATPSFTPGTPHLLG